METRTGRPIRRGPLSGADWITAALDALVEGGVEAVAIQSLALRLGATKGSFYHHFENRDALITAALEEWERNDTTEVRSRLQLIDDPRARLHAVMTEAVTDRTGGLRDAALTAAAAHPLVRPVVARATAERVRYLSETYVELGLADAEAYRRALLTSAAYVGLFQLIRGGGLSVTDAELRAYAAEMLAALIPRRKGGEP